MGVHRFRLALLAVILLLAGCSDAADDASEQTTTTTQPDHTPETDEPDLVDEEAPGTDPLPPLPDDVALPIVFVHGFAGSAQQYESQAMRFVANGYPADRIVAYGHDGSGFDLEA